MRHLLIVFGLTLAQPLGAACPTPPMESEERTALLTAITAAESQADAHVAIDGIWRLWQTAPDKAAQELLNTGLTAIRYGDYLRAEKTFKRLTSYCPSYAEGWNQLAFTYFLTERDNQSLEALERTLALEPAHFGALSGMGLIHIRGGRPEVGQIWLRKALEVNPWLNERALLQDRPGTGSDL